MIISLFGRSVQCQDSKSMTSVPWYVKGTQAMLQGCSYPHFRPLSLILIFAPLLKSSQHQNTPRLHFKSATLKAANRSARPVTTPQAPLGQTCKCLTHS